MQMSEDTTSPDAEREDGIRTAYALLTAEICQLQKDRQEIDGKLQKAKAARDLLGQVLFPSAAKKTRKLRGGTRTAEVVSRSKAALLEAGRPLERAELLKWITESGFKLEARDPARFIGRALWESPDFVHIKKKGYWLEGEDVPN